MGRGKKWGAEERQKLAIAWVKVSTDSTVGRYQTAEVFGQKVYDAYKSLAPPTVEAGTFCFRRPETVMGYWKNSLSPEVMKFNDSLRKVQLAGLTGVTDQEKINMAVAIHIGKTNRPSYNMKTTNPMEWPSYLAWTILKTQRKFAPATPPAAALGVDDGASEEDEDGGGGEQGAAGLTSTPPFGQVFMTPDKENLGGNISPLGSSGAESDVLTTPALQTVGVPPLPPAPVTAPPAAANISARSRGGRDKSKRARKQSSEMEQLTSLFKENIERNIQARDAQMKEMASYRMSMQWRMIYQVCDKEGDNDGKKKAKKRLLQLAEGEEEAAENGDSQTILAADDDMADIDEQA